MGKKITDSHVATWRAELHEGYTLEAVAHRHGVHPQTVRRHAAFEVAGRPLLLGSEVHIDGVRGRWEFHGEIGYSKDGQQHAKFIHSRTGRSRIFHTRLIVTVHRPPTYRAVADSQEEPDT